MTFLLLWIPTVCLGLKKENRKQYYYRLRAEADISYFNPTYVKIENIMKKNPTDFTLTLQLP